MAKKPENYYDKIVHLYDLMYSDKTGFDHKAQVKWVDDWRKKLELPKTVLDLACGTGKHLHFFDQLAYECTGIDASDGLLKIARRENKSIPFKKGYFHSFKLNTKVPIITSFFNSMAYNASEKDMISSLRNIKKYIAEKGVFIFDIFCTSKPETVFLVKTFNEQGIKFSRTFVGIPTSKGFKSIMYYVVFDGKKSEIIEETSIRGVFSEARMRSMLKNAGFTTLYSGEGYSQGSTVFVAQNY